MVRSGGETPGADQLARFFMGAFLAALGMLFVSTLVLYFVYMARASVWPPAGTPAMPVYFWVGLPLLLAGSWAMHRAVSLAGQSRTAASAGLVFATLCLALAFCGLQILSLRILLSGGLALKTQFGALVVILLMLHAAHVFGGIVALACTYWRTRRGEFRPGALASLRSAEAYWHFLDAVWLAVLLLLWATGWR